MHITFKQLERLPLVPGNCLYSILATGILSRSMLKSAIEIYE